jgi:hypothetical protein
LNRAVLPESGGVNRYLPERLQRTYAHRAAEAWGCRFAE